MTKQFVRENKILASIILFMILFGLIHYFRPLCFYSKDGSIREFGIGYKNKTILPIWLVSIILGILCYLSVMYYINM